MLHYVIDLPCDVFFFELINVGFIVKKFYQPFAISWKEDALILLLNLREDKASFDLYVSLTRDSQGDEILERHS